MINGMAGARRAAPSAAVLVTALALGWLAFSSWHHWFVCDDAYISFRYARNLIEGRGLVFNPGEWVEGYTNFLWVLEVAALWTVGVDPATSSCVLSLLWTAATVGVVAAWSRTSEHPGFVAFAALLLLCTERSFAVWATSGLETRQFTLLVLVGVVLAARPGRGAALGMSVALGLATLTRPEGMMVSGLTVGLRLLDTLRFRRERLREELVASVVPLAALVGGHLALRLYLYGEWVPNTYVAKAVGGWPGMGIRYLFAGAIEAGLFLVVPLAVLGFVARYRRTGRYADLAGPITVAAEACFLVWMGGDHFEWRPFDWWWPILFLGAAEGMARWGTVRGVVVLAVVLLYGRTIELYHDRLVSDEPVDDDMPRYLPLTRTSAPWAWRLPLMSFVLDPYNRSMAEATRHLVGSTHYKHRAVALKKVAEYAAYLPVRDQLLLPADAVDARVGMGIVPFYLPDLVVIDRVGLTDATVARNPVPRNQFRKIAHDRDPPPGYLEKRGVNMLVGPAAGSIEQALAQSTHAVSITDQVVLAFDTYGPGGDDWAERAFVGRNMAWRVLDEDVARNLLVLDGERYVGQRLLGTFEDGLGDWTTTGDAWDRTESPNRNKVKGEVGQGYLTSDHPKLREEGTGVAVSPPFDIVGDEVLSLLVAGADEGTGVRLVVDGQAVAVRHGGRDAILRYRTVSLAPWAGRTARVEVFDTSKEHRVAADHIVLLAP